MSHILTRVVGRSGRQQHRVSHVVVNCLATTTTTTTHTTTSFSTKANKKSSSSSSKQSLSYFEVKRAQKELRQQQYKERQERKLRVKDRRSSPRPKKRSDEFQSWFLPQKIADEKAMRYARQQNKPWILRVATIIERLPQILPDKDTWEKDWDELHSYTSQFGKKFPDKYAGDDFFEPEEPEQLTEEYLLSLLPRGFEPAPRETLADETGDVRTLDRKLKTRLYLSVLDDDFISNYSNSSGDTKKCWQFPTVTVKESNNETLLEAAKRAIREKVSQDHKLEFYYPSNCPVAVDVDTFSSNEDYYGVKTFFMKIQYDDGSINGDVSVDDFAWLDRNEMMDKIQSEKKDESSKSKLYHYML